MRRTPTRIVCVLPSRSNACSCKTRKSFGWRSGGMSPISSRKSVPPFASSNRPTRRARAPVNAPFSCPNSSLSRSPLGTAAQLSVTKRQDRGQDPGSLLFHEPAEAIKDLRQRDASGHHLENPTFRADARPFCISFLGGGVTRCSHVVLLVSVDLPQGVGNNRAVPEVVTWAGLRARFISTAESLQRARATP